MRNECNIIKDILPLYVEDMVSADTADFVEEHLKTCDACRAELECMKAPNSLVQLDSDWQENDIAHLKAFKKKWHRHTMFKGIAAALLLVFILIGGYCGYHWMSSVNENDLDALAQQAADYFGYDELFVEKVEQRGNYLAALCSDMNGNWCMCVFDRDSLFENRWCASGGKPSLKTGNIGSWNYGSPQKEAVLIFCGVNLSDDVNWYTFQNDKTIYTCPVENNTVLDIYIISDTRNINGTPVMLDAEQQPLE